MSRPERDAELARLIWMRSAGSRRRERPALDHAAIVAAALAIADAEGLAAVSMRRVAADLGAGTMSLYVYVQSKDELLQLMHDAIAGEWLVPGALPDDWRDALRAIARQTRQAAARHPWTLDLPPRTVYSPNLLRHAEQSLRALATLDIDAYTKVLIISTLDDYVSGYVLGERAERHALEAERAPGSDDVSLMERYLQHMLATGEFPLVAEQVARREEYADRDHFEDGLDLLLDGMAALIARRGRTA
jgi:AcrR family transcriptional regulator